MGITPREEEIRSALKNMSQDVLADTLTLFLSSKTDTQKMVPNTARPPLSNFAQAIAYLKKNYSFPELSSFTTEADLVYYQMGGINGRRIVLNDPMEGAWENITRHQKNTVPFFSDLPVEKAEVPTQNTDSGDTGRFSNLEL